MLRVASLTICLALAVSSAKIDPVLRNTLEKTGTANIFIGIEGGTRDIIQNVQTTSHATRTEKISHLVTSLQELMKRSQQNVITLLQNHQANYKQFWISNQVFVKGATLDLVTALEAIPEVASITEEVTANLNLPTLTQQHEQDPTEWNIQKVEAPQAWDMPGGNDGAGVVVASNDAGVRSTHEALRDNFRSSYGWFDPYGGTDSPSDEVGVGTHIMGILAGKGGIGVAPGSTWISCKACSSVSCSQDALVTCGQWLTCPTLADGTEPDCSKAPRVIANSWGGGAGDDWYNEILAAWRALDIIPVFAVGGSGPGCGTVSSPADQDVVGVGATDTDDNVTSRSSRGPSVGGEIKPDLVAPGQTIRSAGSASDTAYLTLSGSSMGVPHVAGAAAIVLSENPELTYSQVVSILEENADTNLPDLGVQCDIPTNEFPNNVYGHGRLNVRKALEAAISSKL